MTRQSCCCTEGAAWRVAGAECEPCPALHTDHGRQLCPLGPGRGGSGAFARDLDECSLLEEACRGGDCINTDGSFRCSCPEGLSSIYCISSSPHTIHSPSIFLPDTTPKVSALTPRVGRARILTSAGPAPSAVTAPAPTPGGASCASAARGSPPGLEVDIQQCKL